MQPQMDLVLHLTPEQYEKIEAMADERGYTQPESYLLALFESDVAQSKAEVLEDLRQALRESITGQTIPASQLMAELDKDDDDE